MYIGACKYEADHFSFWAKPVMGRDGIFTMKTRSKKTTLEELNEDSKEHGPRYFAKMTDDE